MGGVVDYSYSHPAPSAIKAAGFVGAIRYLGNDNPPQPRVITVAERDSLLAAGLDYGLVWETYASRAGDGFQAGQIDATRANAMADALGFPKDRPIYYAVDFQATPGQVAPYFDGALSVSGGRPVGVYGHYLIIESFVGGGKLGYGWQCAAWSGNGSGTGGSIDGRRLSAHACLFQKVGYVLNNTCDENVVLRDDWGQAGFASTPTTPTKPPEVPQVFYVKINGATYERCANYDRAGDRPAHFYSWVDAPWFIPKGATVIDLGAGHGIGLDPERPDVDVYDEDWERCPKVGGPLAS